MPKKSKPSTRYKIRRKIPDPKYSLAEIVRPHVPKSPRRAKISDEQLAIAPVEAVAPEEAQPFLKWVGGKAQLLVQLDGFFPVEIGRYVEPFIGGGAVFFHLKQRFPAMRAFLRDNNDELINTYRIVRQQPRELMRRLDRHLADFLKDRETYYYLVRLEHHLPETETLKRAARMIFLNKTCFNGLWRVNSKGEFNVPIGSQKNRTLRRGKYIPTQRINQKRKMKNTRRKMYGYECHDCGNDVWLMDAPEEFIYCPFCGEGANDLECLRVLTIRITADEEYESRD